VKNNELAEPKRAIRREQHANNTRTTEVSRMSTPTAVNLMNEADASRFLNLSRAYLRRLRMFQQGPPFIVLGVGGRGIRYCISHLEQYIADHRPEPRGAAR